MVKMIDADMGRSLAERVSPLTEGGTAPSDVDWRQVRWQLQREARALLPDERVAFCMRRIQATAVDVLYSPQNQTAHFGGLMVCGSIWVCPLCAARISEYRRGWVGEALTTPFSAPGGVVRITSNTTHQTHDSI